MKKIILGISTLLLGLAVWAFTSPEPQKQVAVADEEWFVYEGGPYNEPGSYRMVGSAPDCPGSGELCAIRAEKQSAADLPTTASLTYLASISSNFGAEVTGLVEHRTP